SVFLSVICFFKYATSSSIAPIIPMANFYSLLLSIRLNLHILLTYLPCPLSILLHLSMIILIGMMFSFLFYILFILLFFIHFFFSCIIYRCFYFLFTVVSNPVFYNIV